MEFIADLHLHSKYSRAVSQQMVLPEMAKWGAKKGINLLTTGDWTHPLWLRSIKGEREEAGGGVYKIKTQFSNGESKVKTTFCNAEQNLKLEDVRFILTT